MDAAESPLSTSPSTASSFSPQRHFYLAVDRLQFKMETLMDLLGMAGQRPCLPMVVCCSSRDELDAVCSNVSNLSSYISISSLYSDLPEADRAKILDNFRQAIVRWNRLGREKADGEAEKEDDFKSHLIVVTDACLPLLGSTESPVSARILINYELPTKKMSLDNQGKAPITEKENRKGDIYEAHGNLSVTRFVVVELLWMGLHLGEDCFRKLANGIELKYMHDVDFCSLHSQANKWN